MDDMPKVNPYDLMMPIVAGGLRKQVKKAVDYVDKEGILICGVCGKPRQKYIDVPNPDYDHLTKVLAATTCFCEKEAERKVAEEKKRMENHDKIVKFRQLSMIDDKLRDVTFDSLQQNKYNARNIKLCRRYAERFDEMLAKNQGLLLWGDVGLGKSWAAAAIANYLLAKTIPVVMFSLVQAIKNIESKKMSEAEIISMMNSAQLVIIDDLGAERDSSFAQEKVYSIIDSRYRKKLPMIVTTNITLEQMKAECDPKFSRIYDRIFENCYPMQFTGDSWRRVEANKRYVEMEALLAD